MLDHVGGDTDYFADLGRPARVAAAVVLAPFALYFALAGLLTPVAAVAFAVKGEWRMAALLLGIGAAHAVLGAGLCWLARRLFRGRTAAGQVTVLPAWLVWAFLLLFLLPLSVGTAGVMLVEAGRAALVGDIPTAVLLACGATGFAGAAVRAVATGRRRLRGTREGRPGPAPATPGRYRTPERGA